MTAEWGGCNALLGRTPFAQERNAEARPGCDHPRHAFFRTRQNTGLLFAIKRQLRQPVEMRQVSVPVISAACRMKAMPDLCGNAAGNKSLCVTYRMPQSAETIEGVSGLRGIVALELAVNNLENNALSLGTPRLTKWHHSLLHSQDYLTLRAANAALQQHAG